MSALLDDIFINSETFLMTDFVNLKKGTPVFQRCLGWFQWSPSPLAYIYCVISVFSLPLLIAMLQQQLTSVIVTSDFSLLVSFIISDLTIL
jgi:hypothetical protein